MNYFVQLLFIYLMIWTLIIAALSSNCRELLFSTEHMRLLSQLARN